jgi:hypothetical protein
MPQVKDSAAVLVGSVAIVEPLSNYETGAPEGAKVTVVGEGGMSVVKFKQDAFMGFLPIVGSRVAWFVRSAPYSVDSNTGMSVAFVRVANAGDLDLIATIVNAASAETSRK